MYTTVVLRGGIFKMEYVSNYASNFNISNYYKMSNATATVEKEFNYICDIFSLYVMKINVF